MAERDMPAVVDYILESTGQTKMYFVGHSMGGAALFAFLSENHFYDDKVGSIIFYAFPSLVQ